MIIKEAFLQEEIEKVKNFLSRFSLKLDSDVTKTFYMEEEDNVIGTISCANYIIKDLAVDPTYQSENIAGKLVNEMIQYFALNKIFSYQVFTKPIYKHIFLSLGFREIVSTDKVIMLEGGTGSINEELDKIKKQLDMRFAILDESSDIAALVINGNPLTIGHVHLIEYAASLHQMLVVFIVEENKSLFSFEERLSMAYLATRRLSNVCVMPSTKYVVSSLTFPTYFLKDVNEVNEEHAKVDALIFREYFMKKLFIKKRYLGEETNPRMVNYNNTVKEVLQEKVEIIPRLSENGQVVSASVVRSLIEQNKLDEALAYIPRENALVFRSIALAKLNNK